MNVQNMEVVATIQTDFPLMVLIYDVNEDFIIAKVGSAYNDSRFSVDKQIARKYKLYYSARFEDYYFMKDNRRFYLSQTMRTTGW